MNRTTNPGLLVLLAAWLCALLPRAVPAADEKEAAAAQDPVTKAFALPPDESSTPPAPLQFDSDKKKEDTADRGKESDGSARDPVETAFALPRGAHVTAAQRKKLKNLRTKYEPKLRKALDKVEATTDELEKVAAAKAVLRLRKEIHEAILKILVSSPGQRKPAAKKGAANNNHKKKAATRRRKNLRKGSAAKRPTLGVRLPIVVYGSK